jgi:hypothetical protein
MNPSATKRITPRKAVLVSKAATTLTELVEQLSDPAIGAQFAKGFASRYFAPALGALPKSEVDQLVFDSLVEIGLIDPDGAIFTMARALNITPAKARGLLFQHQLRQPLDAAALNAQILNAIGAARFSVDDKRLSFGIESPLVRAAVQARMKQVGIFSDISLSGEILRVPVDQVGDFLAAFLTDDDVNRIAKALKKEGKLPKGWLADHLNKLGAEATSEAGKAALKAGLPAVLGWLGAFAAAHVGALAVPALLAAAM